MKKTCLLTALAFGLLASIGCGRSDPNAELKPVPADAPTPKLTAAQIQIDGLPGDKKTPPARP